MKHLFLLACFCLFMPRLQAQTKAPLMQVATDKDIYSQGDSINWQCALDGFGKNMNTVSLQLFIENVATGQKWHYRFPIINGYNEGAIKVGTTLPNGRYAFNFMLQGDFFNISGKVKKTRAKDSSINYFALFKDKETIVNKAKLSPEGGFHIRGLVFEDTAMFTFSIPGKSDAPNISIVTSLDSAFTPVVPVMTKFINIGLTKDAAVAANDPSKPYHFEMNNPKAHELAGVVVKDRRSNKLLKEYEEEYVTPMFKTADDITLDGLSNDDMEKAGNIYNYLMMHVPGLTATSNPETGVEEIKWRNLNPVIYIDEYRMPEEVPISITPGEIAMIKVYRPGSGPLTGGASNSGAIAIYTKVGQYGRYLPDSDQHNRFYVRCYDGRSVDWEN